MRRIHIALLVLACSASAARAADLTAIRYHAGGFGDVELHTPSDVNQQQVLDVVAVDLYGNAIFSQSWSAFGEGVVQQSWRHTRDNTLDFTLTRLYVEYTRSDAFRLELGQTHTGIVAWNEREHTSRFLQTPIDVPAIARRATEEGAWPLQLLGAYASGRIRGPLGLGWGAGAGAGPGASRDEIQIFNKHDSPAAMFTLSIAPDALAGFEARISGYAASVHGSPEPLRERDATLSLSYINSGTEVRAEWAHMRHDLTAHPVTYRSTGYYALVSKRLWGRLEQFRPYVLIDRLTLAPGEAYLEEASDENAWSAGVRYDVTRHFTIKGEVRTERAPNGERETVGGLQIGVSF